MDCNTEEKPLFDVLQLKPTLSTIRIDVIM